MQNHTRKFENANVDKFNLSIIIPNYNDTNYLKKAIDSVVNQTVKPKELIILDDASTSNSFEVAQSCIENVNFAKLIRNDKNLGYGGVENTNKGLRLASSEYITFLSSNDYIELNFIEIVSKELNKNPNVGIVSCLSRGIDEFGSVTGLLNASVISLSNRLISAKEARKLSTYGGGWIAGIPVYKREYLLAHGGFEKNLYGVCDLVAANIIAGTHGAIFIPKPLVYLRKHPNSLLDYSLTNGPTLNKILTHLRSSENLQEKNFRGGEILRRKLIKRILMTSFLRSNGAININEPELNWKMRKILEISRNLPRLLQKAIIIAVFRWGEIGGIVKFRFFNYYILILKKNFSQKKFNE